MYDIILKSDYFKIMVPYFIPSQEFLSRSHLKVETMERLFLKRSPQQEEEQQNE